MSGQRTFRRIPSLSSTHHGLSLPKQLKESSPWDPIIKIPCPLLAGFVACIGLGEGQREGER